ncbi:MAG: hypothetical protein ACTTJS_02080 [Wolinella sp.]
MRFFVLTLLFCSLILANDWKFQGEVELGKDEVYKIALKQKDYIREIFFRWTLYKNEGLVMHLKYDGFVHQFILYNDYERDSFRLPLFAPEPRVYSYPYLWLVFKDFRRDTKIAKLKFYIHDGGKDFKMINQGKVGSVGFRAY